MAGRPAGVEQFKDVCKANSLTTITDLNNYIDGAQPKACGLYYAYINPESVRCWSFRKKSYRVEILVVGGGFLSCFKCPFPTCLLELKGRADSFKRADFDIYVMERWGYATYKR